MYKNEPYLIQYDTTKYPFRDIINKIFDLEEKKLTLEQIHHYKKYEVVKRENDQKTDWHAMYYEHFPNSFQTLYLALVEELKNRFGYKEIVYQRIPTFRVHLANGNLAVGEWHKDKTYNHGTTELNFWMPFGDTNEYNTIWMESEEDKGDYKPYTVKYGQILVFSGANLYHGNKNNESDETRVSVDFRLVEPARFKPSDSGSINMKVKFDIGGYFEKL